MKGRKKVKKAVKKAKAAQKPRTSGAVGKLTQDEILRILRNVIDPEIGINIVDLGFIYGIDVDGNSVRVRMTLTNPGCPMHQMFIHEVEDALKATFDDVKVNVELVFDPPWSPERMSKDAKRKLGIK